MKSRKLLVTLLVLTALLSCVGSVGAYMRKQTKVVTNTFVPAEVSCRVDEDFNAETKTSVKITNTGDIQAYLRLHVVSYWVKGQLVSGQWVGGKGEIIYKPSSSVSIDYDTSCWLKSGDTYYYIYPVDPEGSTANLLKNNSVITLQYDSSDGTTQVVEVFAEAIQSKPASAVTDSWKVTVDSNGTITKVN